MSWSISLIGNPSLIAGALEKESERLTGESKVEFDAAKAHLQALLKENFSPLNSLVRLTASGHGYKKEGLDVYRQCYVTLEPLTGTLVE